MSEPIKAGDRATIIAGALGTHFTLDPAQVSATLFPGCKAPPATLAIG